MTRLPVPHVRRAALLAVGVAALAVGGPAAAHVSVTGTSTEAGASTVASFSVGHGCSGSPTTALSISVPEGLVVTPVRHPAWTISTVQDESERSGDGHGHGHGGRISQVTFTAEEPLPDGVRDSVQLAFTLPEEAGELVFPVVQECEEGEMGWTQVAGEGQDPHDLEAPAPVLTFTEAAGGAAHGGGDHAAGVSAEDADESDGASSVAWFGAGMAVVALGMSGVALARSRRD